MKFKYKKIKMLSNGKEERDFLYAEDACSGLELLMKNFSKFKKYEFIRPRGTINLK